MLEGNFFRGYSDPRNHIFGFQNALEQHTPRFSTFYNVTTLLLLVIAVQAPVYHFVYSHYAFAARLFLYQFGRGDRAERRIIRACSAGVSYSAWLKCSSTLSDCCWWSEQLSLESALPFGGPGRG